jgi:hypothetical protein
MRKKLEEFAICRKPTQLSAAALEAEHRMLRDRCEARLGLTDAAIEKMVRDYLACRGSATLCPAAYATTSRQYHLGQDA